MPFIFYLLIIFHESIDPFIWKISENFSNKIIKNLILYPFKFCQDFKFFDSNRTKRREAHQDIILLHHTKRCFFGPVYPLQCFFHGWNLRLWGCHWLSNCSIALMFLSSDKQRNTSRTAYIFYLVWVQIFSIIYLCFMLSLLLQCCSTFFVLNLLIICWLAIRTFSWRHSYVRD